MRGSWVAQKWSPLPLVQARVVLRFDGAHTCGSRPFGGAAVQRRRPVVIVGSIGWLSPFVRNPRILHPTQHATQLPETVDPLIVVQS